MPPAKDMGSEGGSQTALFLWGNGSMADWSRTGYGTTYETYGARFATDRKAFDRGRLLREATPWSTSNHQYGKGVPQGGATSLHAGSSITGSYGSVPSYRSQPQPAAHLTDDRPHARQQLEQRLRRRPRDVTSGDDGQQPSGGDADWKLPKLDPSKYLVAQGPGTGWKGKAPSVGVGSGTTQRPEVNKSSHSRPDVAPSQSPAWPPQTSEARKYMRDTLGRFLLSIPTNLRPKTREKPQPREEAQVLKVEHGLPERTTTFMSHAVPSRSSNSSSASGSSVYSDDGVVNLNDPAYDIRNELSKE